MRRPRVGVQQARGLQDVQRFYMAMRPASRSGAPSRLVIIGKKRLPAVERHERFFGFVAAVAPTVSSGFHPAHVRCCAACAKAWRAGAAVLVQRGHTCAAAQWWLLPEFCM